MGIDISLPVSTLLVIGTLNFQAWVPPLPASVGAFEFGVVYLLATIGVGDGGALRFALAIHGILFTPPILIAIIVSATWAITSLGNSIRSSPHLLAADSLQAQKPLK